jgi:hypothetical protein
MCTYAKGVYNLPENNDLPESVWFFWFFIHIFDSTKFIVSFIHFHITLYVTQCTTQKHENL